MKIAEVTLAILLLIGIVALLLFMYGRYAGARLPMNLTGDPMQVQACQRAFLSTRG